jgi:flagellar biosynthesis anti-sigma factor FlgM
MSNKIHGYGQPQVPVTRGSHGSPAESPARVDEKPVEAVAPARDAVSLTDSAFLMRKLEEAVQRSSTTDATHVQRVREALGRNEYVVDAQRVADTMRKFERDLDGQK